MKIPSFPYQLMKGLRVTVVGLGVHGGGPGSVIWLMRQGARVTISDTSTRAILRYPLREIQHAWKILSRKEKNRRFYRPLVHLGALHSDRIDPLTKRDIRESDAVIINPGVPHASRVFRYTVEMGKPYRIADTSIFIERSTLPIIGITGTRGKTSTSSLAGQLLLQRYPRTIVSGNIGSSPLLLVPERWRSKALLKEQLFTRIPTSQPIVVLELSSWQCEGLEQIKRSPLVSVCTTLYPEHLNRYKNVTKYYRAKSSLFRYQQARGVSILNYDQVPVRSLQKLTRARIVWISQRPLPMNERGVYVDGGWLWLKEKQRKPQRLIQRNDIPILGEHQTTNILAATAIAWVFGLQKAEITNALRKVSGVPGRLEYVATRREVSYYNDTAATSPEATIAALHALPPKRDIILIAGGADKGLSYKECAQEIHRRVREVILFSGPGSDELERELRGLQGKHSNSIRLITGVTTMKSAVSAARRVSRPTDIVLLSPASASFGLFRHAEDRGRQFVRAVKIV